MPPHSRVTAQDNLDLETHMRLFVKIAQDSLWYIHPTPVDETFLASSTINDKTPVPIIFKGCFVLARRAPLTPAPAYSCLIRPYLGPPTAPQTPATWPAIIHEKRAQGSRARCPACCNCCRCVRGLVNRIQNDFGGAETLTPGG